MADEPRKRPRPRRDDDDDDQDRNQGYRLRDDDDEPPRARPRPRPIRRDDPVDDEAPRRPKRIRPRSASVPTMDNWLRIIFGGVVVLAILIGLAIFGVWYMLRSNQAAVFKPAMSAYLTAPTGPANPDTPHVVRGKMVVVDVGKYDVDWDIHFALPDGLKAAKPQDVGTVVQTRWGKNQIDSYDNGSPAYVQTCHVIVIDLQSRTVLWEQQYQGTEPPQTIDSKSSEGDGSKPTEEVLQFLKGLPRG